MGVRRHQAHRPRSTHVSLSTCRHACGASACAVPNGRAPVMNLLLRAQGLGVVGAGLGVVGARALSAEAPEGSSCNVDMRLSRWTRSPCSTGQGTPPWYRVASQGDGQPQSSVSGEEVTPHQRPRANMHREGYKQLHALTVAVAGVVVVVEGVTPHQQPTATYMHREGYCSMHSLS